jgi:hypothetical protein
MPIGNFRPPGPWGPQCFSEDSSRLRSHRLNVPGQAGARSESGDSLSTVYDRLMQVDWKTTLEGTENFQSILELSNDIAKRGAGMMAFRRKYYSALFDEITLNRSQNYRGIVVSANWRRYFDRLDKFGKVLKVAGIPVEAAQLSWEDLSAKGISANVMTTTARWSVKSVLLSVPETAHLGMQGTGWALERLGFREAANDLEVFSVKLEGAINDAERVIDQTLSVSSARDVLTWDRSVINPRNWSLLADGVRSHFEDLAAETQPLYNNVVQSIGTWFSRR